MSGVILEKVHGAWGRGKPGAAEMKGLRGGVDNRLQSQAGARL